MRSQLARALRATVGCVVLSACTQQGPGASKAEIARAERVYRQCVEDELGLELREVEIWPSGDIEVEFAQDYPEEALARAVAVCEPRIGAVLEPGGVSVLGPPENLGRPATDRELEQLLASRAKLGFQGAILIEAAGERRLSAGYGKLRAGSTRVPDAETAFDCGSIMKQVTAALVFLLEEEGALSRQQTLGELFDAAAPAFRAVTLDQVLAHRAGFHEYHDTEGDFEPMDRATALAHIFAQQPLFTPGSESAYSNAGYTLLAAVIELISGDDYRAVARERVFEPLGMERTGFYGDPLWDDGNVAVGGGASSYRDNDPAHWPEPSWALLGNGGLVSTLEDQLRLAKALDGDGLFRRAATREAFRALHGEGSIAGKGLTGYAGGNDFGFSAVVGKVVEDSTYVIAGSHVLAPVTAEILAIELVQALYGAVAVLPESP
jgi:CubicO group peptidase (beta-lactamase class C family)